MKTEGRTLYAPPAIETVDLMNEQGFAASLPSSGTSPFENDNEGIWN